LPSASQARGMPLSRWSEPSSPWSSKPSSTSIVRSSCSTTPGEEPRASSEPLCQFQRAVWLLVRLGQTVQSSGEVRTSWAAPWASATSKLSRYWSRWPDQSSDLR
jgi:hypothetical protein